MRHKLETIWYLSQLFSLCVLQPAHAWILKFALKIESHLIELVIQFGYIENLNN